MAQHRRYNENLTKIAESYLKKGSKCYVEGKLRTRSYTDKDGQERKTTEIVIERFNGEITLLDSQRSAPDPDSYGKVSDRPSARPTQQLDDPRQAMQPARLADIIDDDIPF